MSLEHSSARTAALFSPPDASLKIDELCQAEKISRSMLYEAWSEGWGPKFYRFGAAATTSKPQSRVGATHGRARAL